MKNGSDKEKSIVGKIIIRILLVVVILLAVICGVIFFKNAKTARDVKNHIDRADKFIIDMDYDGAIAELQTALKIDPKKEETYLKLADVYMAKADYLIDEKKFDDALGCYKDAIDVLKDSRDYIDSKKIENCIDDLKELRDKVKEKEKEWEESLAATEEAEAVKEAEASDMAEAVEEADKNAATDDFNIIEPDNEPNTEVYEVLGAASMGNGDAIVLTPANFFCSGAIWCDEKIDSYKPFTVELDICADQGSIGSISESFINGKTTGADGIVINFSPNIFVGSAGTEMGFSGAIGVELDSYPFGYNDPEEQHVALISESTTNHIASAMCGTINDENWHHVKINYDDGNFDVFFDSQKAFSAESRLEGEVYIGVTAATGSACNRQMIRNFKIKN